MTPRASPCVAWRGPASRLLATLQQTRPRAPVAPPPTPTHREKVGESLLLLKNWRPSSGRLVGA